MVSDNEGDVDDEDNTLLAGWHRGWSAARSRDIGETTLHHICWVLAGTSQDHTAGAGTSQNFAGGTTQTLRGEGAYITKSMGQCWTDCVSASQNNHLYFLFVFVFVLLYVFVFVCAIVFATMLDQEPAMTSICIVQRVCCATSFWSEIGWGQSGGDYFTQPTQPHLSIWF